MPPTYSPLDLPDLCVTFEGEATSLHSRPVCRVPPLSLCTAGAGPERASVTQILPWLLEKASFRDLKALVSGRIGENQELRPGQYRRGLGFAWSGNRHLPRSVLPSLYGRASNLL